MIYFIWIILLMLSCSSGQVASDLSAAGYSSESDIDSDVDFDESKRTFLVIMRYLDMKKNLSMSATNNDQGLTAESMPKKIVFDACMNDEVKKS